jgi:dipeptidase D
MIADIHRILEIFEHVSAIPRCSKKEDRLSAWLTEWVAKRRFSCRKDRA